MSRRIYLRWHSGRDKSTKLKDGCLAWGCIIRNFSQKISLEGFGSCWTMELHLSVPSHSSSLQRLDEFFVKFWGWVPEISVLGISKIRLFFSRYVVNPELLRFSWILISKLVWYPAGLFGGCHNAVNFCIFPYVRAGCFINLLRYIAWCCLLNRSRVCIKFCSQE